MIWLGLFDGKVGRFDPTGLGAQFRNSDACLTQGTLLLEISPACTNTLLAKVDWGPGNTVHIRAETQDRYSITLDTAAGTESKALSWAPDRRVDTIRLSFVWDCIAGWADLRLDAPGHPNTYSVTVSNPEPVPANAFRSLFLLQDVSFQHDVRYCALAKGCIPLGRLPACGPDTPVATTSGQVPIRSIKAGTRLRSGGVVLANVACQVPALGTLKPIALAPPHLGLRRPVLVAPHQRIVLFGTDVEYAFGYEGILTEARDLTLAHATTRTDLGPFVTYFQLLLATPAPCIAEGAMLETFFAGRLRRKPEILKRSALRALHKSILPEHAQPICPVVQSEEAAAVLLARAA